MPRKVSAPIFYRNGRAYLDARAYADVGGKKEPLVAPGERLATKDPIVARELAARRIKELEGLRRHKTLHGVAKRTTLGSYAEYHLREKARESEITDQWLAQAERHLSHALTYFGDVDLTAITTEKVQKYAGHLSETKDRRGRLLSPGTRRQYLNSLSNLYRRAAGEGYVLPGYNPVQALMHKPTASRKEASWLEVPDAALLLEAARLYKPKKDNGISAPMLHALVATFLLTGGRYAEVAGLAVDDVNFARNTVTFRPHPWRRLKTITSRRVVPLWPQLREILQGYIFAGSAPLGTLLFPATRGHTDEPITDVRKSLDAAAELVGWKAGEIRTKMFRHTYCAARLQTLDRGHPVSIYTVAKEMGHGGDALVRRIYGHLGEIRHRAPVVEYRIEQHRQELGERLRALDRAI